MTNSSGNIRDVAYDATEFCSTREAAAILGVSHRTVQLWVESGVLQAWKTAGGHRRITMKSVEKLVLERRQAVKGPAETAAAPALKQVLIVDDEPAMLRLYELELGGWNLPMELVKAHDGFEALLKIGQRRPDLLITDLHMPGMDGFRMLDSLRNNPEYDTIGVIVVSGIEPSTIAAKSLPSDLLVLPKPVPFARLREAVEAALQLT